MKNSLVHMEDSVQIDAPIKVVFAYLTDFRNTSNWHKNMKRQAGKPMGLMEWALNTTGLKLLPE